MTSYTHALSATMALVPVIMTTAFAWAPAKSNPLSVTSKKAVTAHIDGNAVRQYRFHFRADRAVHIQMQGNGRTDLDLIIYDERGNEIISDVGHTDQCGVSWSPSWSGQYMIEIRNVGDGDNTYRLSID